jgi:hypothetical protein
MVGPIARGFACAVAFAAAAACQPETPEPRLRTVAPSRAYTDRPLRLILRGERFVPSFHIDLRSGERTAETEGFRGWVGIGGAAIPLVDFGWRSDSELSATLMPGLTEGRHPVVVVDPRGATAELEQGFISLGLDRTPPQVTVVRPASGAPLAGGGPLRGTLEISDEGSLSNASWQVAAAGRVVGAASCLVPAAATRISCDFEVLLPRELRAGEAVELQAVASDAALPANTLSLRRDFILGDPPSIAQVVPTRGGSGGGTEVVVWGARLVPGSRVFFGRLPLGPDGGLHLNETTITGRAPPNAAGSVDIRVVTPIGEARLVSGFQYLSPPVVSAVEPVAGTRAGGFPVRVKGKNFTGRTRIHLGRTLGTAVPLAPPAAVAEDEILSVAPAAAGADLGPVSVFAVDPDAGVSAPLVDAFTWTGP